MARSIVLPLYPHTSDAEIADILEDLRRIGLDGAQVVHSYVGEAELQGAEEVAAAERPWELLSGPEQLAELDRREAARRVDDRRTDELLDRVAARAAGSDGITERLMEDGPEDFTCGGIVPVAKPDVDDYAGFARGDVELPERPLDRARELRLVRDHAEVVGLDRFHVERPETFRDHAEEIGYHRSVRILELASAPIAGRPGWRRTPDGREWYSSVWLDRTVAS